MHKLRVSEYARLTSDNEKSIYRKIHNGELKSEKLKGILHIICEELPSDPDRNSSDNQILVEKDARIEQLKNENEYLRKELSKAQEELSEVRQRSDTIILQFTKQLEQQKLMLEDMRNRPLWRRVKMLFAPAQ